MDFFDVIQNYFHKSFTALDQYDIPKPIFFIGSFITAFCIQVCCLVIGKYLQRDSITDYEKNIMELSEKTGFNAKICKKALDRNKFDSDLAEEWLKEYKGNFYITQNDMQKRQMNFGRIGVLIKGKIAVLVEINCKSAELAKKNCFSELIQSTTSACMQFAEKIATDSKKKIIKICLDSQQLKDLKHDNKTLEQHLSKIVQPADEKVCFKRAICYKVANDINLSGYTLPEGKKNEILIGSFGCIMAFKHLNNKDEPNVDEMGKSICKQFMHVQPKNSLNLKIENDDGENKLLQEFLYKVGIEIVDFKKFVCGEIEYFE